jgi:hypothetical protein
MIELIIIAIIVAVALYVAVKFLLPILKIIGFILLVGIITFCIYRSDLVEEYYSTLKERYEENKNDLTNPETLYNEVPTRLDVEIDVKPRTD